ncbi:nuclear transport factor 2 family protein [Thermaurantiacus sp.]
MTDQRLQELLDRQAIEDVIARYARTLDWLDEEGQASCYWPDATIDYGFFQGTAADFVPRVMAIERASSRRWHLLTGLIVRFTSPTRAEAECYGIAAGLRREGEGPHRGNLYGGRYLDSFEKRGHEWRISARTYILDWTMPIPDQPDSSPRPGFPLPILDILEPGHPRYRPM